MASADMPNDGRGGSLYNSPISIPNYANTTLSTSYSAIDGYLFSGSASGTTFGVAFGACLMTLIHVLLFTMPDKRGRVIFNCIVVGLVLEVIRQFCGVWAVTRSGTNSSYFLLTLPPDNATDSELLAYVTANAYTNFSLGTKVNATIDGLTSILAFFTIQVCFYVLVHTMMSARRRKTIRIVTVSLAGVGAHAAVWRFVQFVLNTISVFNQTMNSAPPAWLILVAEVAYAVSICAWCLVYGFLVFRSALARIRLGVEFRRGEARHVMFMTAIESMIVPIIFVVLQWATPSWFPGAEYCVAPSIFISFPFGTLWASSFDPKEAHRGHAGRYQPREDRSGINLTDSNPVRSNITSISTPSQPLFDRKAPKAPGLAMVRSNASNLEADAITPAPPTPNTSAPHPFEDIYSDTDSKGIIRIRRQFTVNSNPRSPMQRFNDPTHL